MRSGLAASLLASALLLSLGDACGPPKECATASAVCSGTPLPAQRTAEAAPQLTIGGRTYSMSRTLPPDGVSADALEHAAAGTRGNLSVEMFQPVGTTAGVRDWELVSGAGGGGWDVWEPSVVRRLVSEFAGASPVAVSNAMWPDRCLGLPQAPVEPCSPTPVPGFLVTIAIAGKTFEYRVGEDGGASIVRNVPSVEPTPRSPSATPDARPSAPGG